MKLILSDLQWLKIMRDEGNHNIFLTWLNYEWFTVRFIDNLTLDIL